MPTNPDRFIPPHGGYRSLLSYQRAEIVYDITVRFCQRFLPRTDRTIDQMVQAARSGKQNIAEGSAASGTSKEMEIKLTGVARASLEESCSSTTTTSCAPAASPSGPRTQRRRSTSGACRAARASPTRPTATSSTPAPRPSSPTSPSA
ncbi:MAG: four helix bundle protein [Phycisphaerales bacterium]